ILGRCKKAKFPSIGHEQRDLQERIESLNLKSFGLDPQSLPKLELISDVRPKAGNYDSINSEEAFKEKKEEIESVIEKLKNYIDKKNSNKYKKDLYKKDLYERYLYKALKPATDILEDTSNKNSDVVITEFKKNICDYNEISKKETKDISDAINKYREILD